MTAGPEQPDEALRSLYPKRDAYATHMLDVGDGNVLYVEESGNPHGKPAVVVHGGPGGGSSPNQRRFFEPDTYRVVLVDQRGCGHSTPTAASDPTSVDTNTTWHLVADLERVREFLDIDKWLVFGGSWGSTLALAYAQSHPSRATELVLRGIFMLRKSELAFFYQDGASHLFPDAWESYVAPIPTEERDDLIGAFHRRLFGNDPAMALECATAWAKWERATSLLSPKASTDSDEAMLNLARIENHYFVNGGFFEHERQLLDGVDRIRDIPAVIGQGRYDCVCPPRTAWELHREWPEAELILNTFAGHSMFDPHNASALITATDRFGGLTR